MAYFDSTELVNYIRNAFAVEDDTGLSCKILERPTKASRAMGLSLNFGENNDDSGSENGIQYSPNYFPDLDEDVFCVESTSEMINERLKWRNSAAETQRVYNCSEQRPTLRSFNSSENLFYAKLEDAIISQPLSSMTSRLIANTAVDSKCRFEEYAKFEAMSGSPCSRTMTIVFPFCKPSACSIPICILSSTTLSNLIGLSCYVYTRERREPPCDNPACYSLYLAEENLEYDTELPPQDRHRLVSECGFPVLALVKNSELVQNQLYSVNVYFVNGKCFNYELESLDIPLEWLFDQAHQKKCEEILETRRDRNSAFRSIQYILETIEQKNCPLKLTNTISSTGCTDFVFLRLNSSRGEYFNSTIGANLSSTSNLRMQNKSTYESFQQFDLFSTSPSTNQNTLVTMKSQDQNDLGSPIVNNSDDCVLTEKLCGEVLEEYVVDRLHKIKPKWLARFVICERGLEIIPSQSIEKRKSFVPQPTQKTSRIFWDMIGSVEVNPVERSNARRVIRIIYLLVPESYHHIFMSNTTNLHDTNEVTKDLLIKAFKLSIWKTLQVEVGNDEGWYIGIKLLEILDARFSMVQSVYKHSAFATKRPLQAAESALNLNFLPIKRSSSTVNPSLIMTTTNSFKTKFKLINNELRNYETVVTSSQQSIDPNLTKTKSEKRKISMVFSKMLSRQD